MCTAVKYKNFFGRNLDYEVSYGEKVVVISGNFPLEFRCKETLKDHYAIIGMGAVSGGYPLFFDGMNEKGLAMAGLNFPGNCRYYQKDEEKDNIAPFEFIPWILGQCKNVSEARKLIDTMNMVDINFSKELPLSPLHWMISDVKESIVVETMEDGLKVYENPVEVLTNNPPFDIMLFSLNNYMDLSTELPDNTFARKLELDTYSRGMGALGLPGDLSSQSRFIKATFTKLNSKSTGEGDLSQMFHILGAVKQQRGLVHIEKDKYEITIYSSCCDLKKGIYYYTTYHNQQITAVDMHKCCLDGEQMTEYPLHTRENVYRQN